MSEVIIESRYITRWFLAIVVLIVGGIAIPFSVLIFGGFLGAVILGFFQLNSPLVAKILLGILGCITLYIYFLIGIKVLKKAKAKTYIKINNEYLTLVRENEAIVIPLKSILYSSISSKPLWERSLLYKFNTISTIHTSPSTGLLLNEAAKAYYLNFTFHLDGQEKHVTYDVTDFRGTTKLVETFKGFNISIKREDEDLIEKLWDNQSNRLPFIFAIIAFPITGSVFYSSPLKGDLIFDRNIFMILNIIGSILVFSITKSIIKIMKS